MITSPEEALRKFTQSNLCFSPEYTAKIVNALGGPVRFTLVSICLREGSKRVADDWLLSMQNIDLSFDEAYTITLVSENDYSSISTDIRNICVIFNDHSGFSYNASELLTHMHITEEATGTRNTFYWGILTEYSVRRVCEDFCLFCEENNIVFDEFYKQSSNIV